MILTDRTGPIPGKDSQVALSAVLMSIVSRRSLLAKDDPFEIESKAGMNWTLIDSCCGLRRVRYGGNMTPAVIRNEVNRTARSS